MDSKKLKNMYFKTREIYNKKTIKKRSRNKVRKLIGDKKVLTKDQISKIKEFYKPYKNVTTDFHEFYTQKTGKFYANYLPDDLYYCDIDMYFNNWHKGEIIDNKCYYERMFPKIKQPETFAYKINGFWYDKETTLISEEKVLLKSKEEKELFVKYATNSSQSSGVFYVDNSNNNISEQIEKIIKKDNRDIIIQKPVKQHKVLKSFNPSSVNTIRVLSLLTEQDVKIYSCILKIGANGEKADNIVRGGMTCGIKPDGFLKDIAYDSKGNKIEKVHPASKIEFSTVQIPKFEEICKTVKEAHKLVPNFRLVSWDITVDEDENVVLIEANLKYGELNFHQFNNGPLFGDDTKAILDEVFAKK